MPNSNSSLFICSKCDAQAPKWSGQCFECGAWGTLEESARPLNKKQGQKSTISSIKFESLDNQKNEFNRISSGIQEVDRVLGGGFVPGSIVLLGGEPGVGKSTLCLQIAKGINGGVVLYFSGEESAAQVADRWKRLEGGDNLKFAQITNADEISAAIIISDAPLAIVDSVQTITSQSAAGLAGSVSQVRAVTSILLEAAKKGKTSVILTGHVTKDGMVAGPKTLEHLVDVVLYLEGDRSYGYRLLRGVKNRFGSTDEVGVFVMSEIGLSEVQDPSTFFLNRDRSPESGQAVAVIMEGKRVFLAEVQALCEKTAFGYPQRKSSGFDVGRLQLLLAVLGKRLRLPLGMMDVFLNVVGGLKIIEPAGDLAVCAALISACKDRPVPSDAALFGEVGLGGEVRSVSMSSQRTKEAKRLGFKKVISVNEVKHLRELERLLW